MENTTKINFDNEELDRIMSKKFELIHAIVDCEYKRKRKVNLNFFRYVLFISFLLIIVMSIGNIGAQVLIIISIIAALAITITMNIKLKKEVKLLKKELEDLGVDYKDEYIKVFRQTFFPPRNSYSKHKFLTSDHSGEHPTMSSNYYDSDDSCDCDCDCGGDD